jgi:hypothetical protein
VGGGRRMSRNKAPATMFEGKIGLEGIGRARGLGLSGAAPGVVTCLGTI